ncbi:hypothetical protein JYK22_39685, partial [Nonomuraea sp. RK-328]|nr:hypothetical protein [Nonomuraea sp. RK-328]
MAGIVFDADHINSWLAAWEHNLFYAQRPDEGERRRLWARVAFAALDGAERAGCPARIANKGRFNLRALLIANLGSGSDPLWDPDRLAADVLAVLPLTLEQAADWAGDWRQHPRDEILDLRICKSLVVPLKSIIDLSAEAPARALIDRWLDLWPRLP